MRRARDTAAFALAALGVLAAAALQPPRAQAQMFCTCDRHAGCDDLSGATWVMPESGTPPPECPCDLKCGVCKEGEADRDDCSVCACDTTAACDRYDQPDAAGNVTQQKCACDPQCMVGPVHVGRIASRGLVKYKDGQLASYQDLQATPRWTEYALTASTGVSEGDVIADGAFEGAQDPLRQRTDLTAMSVTEFNAWVARRKALDELPQTRALSVDEFRSPVTGVQCRRAASECDPAQPSEGDPCVVFAGAVVRLAPTSRSVVVRDLELPGPCDDVLLFESPLHVAAQERPVYDPVTQPGGFTSLLIGNHDGSVVKESPHVFAYETAFMSFDEQSPEWAALPSGCKINSAPIANPRRSEIEAWRFINCPPAAMSVLGDCPDGMTPGEGGNCQLLRAWQPVSGALVEMANYGAFRYARTNHLGYYAMEYRVLPDSLFNFDVYATMTYENFNPRHASSRAFYVAGRGAASSTTSSTFTNFAIEAAMLTMESQLTNEGLLTAGNPEVELVDVTYAIGGYLHRQDELSDPEGDPPEGAPPAITTQYHDPDGPDAGAGADAGAADPFRNIGLLKQISAADLRDTHVYVYRQSDGQLVGSRWGLRHPEIVGHRLNLNGDGDFEDPGELPPPGCENAPDGGTVTPYACAKFSALVRGPASLWLGQATSRLNPAASIPPVSTADGVVLNSPRFGIEVDYSGTPDTRRTHLRAGDQVKIVVVNRATGYIGSVLAIAARDATGMMVFQAVEQPERTLALDTEDPVAVRLSNRHRIEMKPPNLRIRATRKPRALDPESDPDVDYVIGSEGAGLTSDQTITIETEWFDHDGSVLPENLPGYTGRIAKIVSPGAGDETIPLDAGRDAAPIPVALAPDECVNCSLDGAIPDGGLPGTGALAGEAGGDQVGQFPIEPGKHTIVVRLPQRVDVAHYYIHVDGASNDKNVDFIGRDKPPEASFSVNQVCYSNCGLGANPAGGTTLVEDDCHWECFLKQGGPGEGALRQRPASFVPFMVPMFDASATRAAIEAEAAALREQLGTLPIDQVVLPRQENLAVHRWVYRPEYHFSLLDLDLRSVDLRTDYDDGRFHTGIDVDYGLTDSTLPSLERFGDPRDLLFSIGFQRFEALIGDDELSVDDLEDFLVQTPAEQLQTLQDAIDVLTPADYLTLQLYAGGDLGNPLLEMFGVPVVLTEATQVRAERTFHHAQFPQSAGGESLPAAGEPPGADGSAPFHDEWQNVEILLTRRARLIARVLTRTGDDDEETIAVGTLADTLDRVDPGAHHLVIDHKVIKKLAQEYADEHGGAPPISTRDHPEFFVRVIAVTDASARDLDVELLDPATNPDQPFYGGVELVDTTRHVLDLQGKLSERHDSLMLGEVVVHDVLIQNGTLQLTREDFGLPGYGPQLSFVRSYTNLSNDTGTSPLGPGWGHSLDKRLQGVSTSPNSTSVPEDIAALVGQFVGPERLAQVRSEWTVVSVNGSVFRKFEGSWYGEQGRHGKLFEYGREDTLDGNRRCADYLQSEQDEKCFVFVAKDGTRYFYEYPRVTPETPPQTRTKISVDDGLVYRLYDAGTRPDAGDAEVADAGDAGLFPDVGTGPSVLQIPEDQQVEAPQQEEEEPLPKRPRWGRLLAIEDRNFIPLVFDYEFPKQPGLLTRVKEEGRGEDSFERSVCLYYDKLEFERLDERSSPDRPRGRKTVEHRLVRVVGPDADGVSPSQCAGENPPSGDGLGPLGNIVLRFEYHDLEQEGLAVQPGAGPLSVARRAARQERYTYAAEEGVSAGEQNLVEATFVIAAEGGEPERTQSFHYQYHGEDEIDLGSPSDPRSLAHLFNDLRPTDIVKAVSYPFDDADNLDVGALIGGSSEGYAPGRQPIAVDTAQRLTGVDGAPPSGYQGPTALFRYDNSGDRQQREVTDLRHRLRGSGPELTTTYLLSRNGNPEDITGPARGTGGLSGMSERTRMGWRVQGQNNEMCAKHVLQGLGDGGVPRWTSTYFTYDEQGNVATEVGPVTSSSEPAFGCGPAPSDPTRTITRAWHQHVSVLESRTDRNLNQESWSYDTDDGDASSDAPGTGNLTRYTDADGHRHEYVVDARGLRRRECHPQIAADGALGAGAGAACTRLDYDGWGNPSLVQPEGTPGTVFDYDGRGRLVSVTDPNGQTTSYEHDALDNVVLIAYPPDPDAVVEGNFDFQAQPEHFEPTVCRRYDSLGNKLAESDRNGLLIAYAYTSRNQVKSVQRHAGAPLGGCTAPAGTSPLGRKQFLYDASGNLAAETDWLGHQTRYQYDEQNHRTLTQDRRGWVMVEDHDLAGNQVSMRDYGAGTADSPPPAAFAGSITLTTYDALDRPTKVVVKDRSDATIRVRTMTYFDEADPEKNLASITAWHANEASPPGATAFQYDGRYHRILRTDPTGATFSSTYDARGNLERTVDEEGAIVSYFYDKQNRLLGTRERGRTLGASGLLTKFVYDDNGNRTEVWRWRSQGDDSTLAREISYFDAWNRKRVVQAPPRLGVQGIDLAPEYESFAYDGEGNVIRSRDRRGGVTVTLRNQRGLPTDVTDRTGAVSSFTHDENGNVELVTVSRSDVAGGIVTRTTHDSEDRPSEVVQGENRPAHERRTTAFSVRDPMGRPVVVTDGNGASHVTIYNALGLPQRMFEPVAAAFGEASPPGPDGVNAPFVERAYYATGKVESETNRRTKTTRYFYDQLERLTVVVDPLGGTSLQNGETHRHAITTYDRTGRVKAAVDRRGFATENGYDEFGRLQSVRRFALSGSPVPIPSPGTEFLDTEGVVITPASAPITIVSYDLDDQGNRIAETDALENTTFHEYDRRNQLVRTSHPSTPATSATDARTVSGRAVTERRYDANGNLRLVIDEEGRVTRHGYDGENRLVSTELAGAPRNLPGAPGADQLALLLGDDEPQCAGPSAQTASCADELTTQAYDESGNVVEVVKPEGQPGGAHEGRKQLLAYDALDRLTRVTQQLGASGALVTRYVYDGNDNLTHVCTPRGQGPGGNSPEACETAQEKDIEYVYDLRNRRTSHIQRGGSAGDRTTTFGYDDEDNLTVVTDPKGQVQAYEYDDLDRRIGYCTTGAGTACQLAGVAGAYETESIVWRHDGNGNVFEVAESKRRPDGTTATETSTYVYDLFDRMDASTQRGRSLDFDYDNNGNRIRIASSGAAGHETVYHYDERNRLQRVELESDPPTAYTYYSDGRLKEVAYPNTARMHYGYAATGRVGSIRSEGAGGLLLAQHGYDYDSNGNRIEQREDLRLGAAVSQETTRYRYDATDRLTAFWVFGGAAEKLTQYGYEGFNRRTEKAGVPVATNPSDPAAFPASFATPTLSRRYAYDPLEQLNWARDYDPQISNPDDGTPSIREIAYGYDANGNTETRTDTQLPAENVHFDYDAQNRMVLATQAGTTIVGRYDYNAAGMRIRHELSDRGNIEYLHDERAVIEEHDAATGALIAHYRYADRLLRLDTGSGIAQYYHHDALGSTVALSASDGGSVTGYRLDPWGNVADPGPAFAASVNRRVFTGHEHDERTKLIYAGARYYDPATGRFLTQDAYLGEAGTPPSLHRYLYAYGNPLVWWDPTGYDPMRAPNRACGDKECRTAAAPSYWEEFDNFYFGGSNTDAAIETKEAGKTLSDMYCDSVRACRELRAFDQLRQDIEAGRHTATKPGDKVEIQLDIPSPSEAIEGIQRLQEEANLPVDLVRTGDNTWRQATPEEREANLRRRTRARTTLVTLGVGVSAGGAAGVKALRSPGKPKLTVASQADQHPGNATAPLDDLPPNRVSNASPSPAGGQRAPVPSSTPSNNTLVGPNGETLLESRNARVLQNGEQSASARTNPAIHTAVRADLGEAEAYKQALLEGEVGLRRPGGANVKGADFITARIDDQTGRVVLYANDAKTSSSGKFPRPDAHIPSAWRQEVIDAANAVDLSNPALEQRIRQAAADGHIEIRQINVDYSTQGQGRVSGF